MQGRGAQTLVTTDWHSLAGHSCPTYRLTLKRVAHKRSHIVTAPCRWSLVASHTETNRSPAALPPLLQEGQGHRIS